MRIRVYLRYLRGMRYRKRKRNETPLYWKVMVANGNIERVK